MQTLAGLLNESKLDEAPMSAREKKRYDKTLAKLKALKSEYKKTLQAAIRELTKNEEDMTKIILTLNNMVMTPEEREEFVQDKIKTFWNYNTNSPVNKVVNIIQDFGRTAQI